MTAQPTHRQEERVAASLPVSLGEWSGLTRNVSASGLFFEMDEHCVAGGEIGFSVELETPAGKILLHCQGTVVRTERCGGRIGVAVKISEQTMEMVA